MVHPLPYHGSPSADRQLPTTTSRFTHCQKTISHEQNAVDGGQRPVSHPQSTPKPLSGHGSLRAAEPSPPPLDSVRLREPPSAPVAALWRAPPSKIAWTERSHLTPRCRAGRNKVPQWRMSEARRRFTEPPRESRIQQCSVWLGARTFLSAWHRVRARRRTKMSALHANLRTAGWNRGKGGRPGGCRGVPSGTIENSPAIHRWVGRQCRTESRRDERTRWLAEFRGLSFYRPSRDLAAAEARSQR